MAGVTNEVRRTGETPPRVGAPARSSAPCRSAIRHGAEAAGIVLAPSR